MNIIHQIVDQQPVLASDQEICRAVIQRLRGGISSYLSLCHRDRIHILKVVIDRAKYNQQYVAFIKQIWGEDCVSTL